MSSKNKKIIIAGLTAFILIVVALLAATITIEEEKQDFSQLGEVREAANLDEYIKTDPELAYGKNLQSAGVERREINLPVATKIQLNKIVMAPVGLVGGDVIYAAVGELPNNNFFRLEPDNLNKIFLVSTPEEALKYVDFLMVTAGRSSYDRTRTTVWQVSDYDKIGCRVMPEEENLPLPKDRPISQSKQLNNGFEVTWIYFTPTLPAGYHKMMVEVGKDGGISVKDNPEEAFWPCGKGFVF